MCCTVQAPPFHPPAPANLPALPQAKAARCRRASAPVIAEDTVLFPDLLPLTCEQVGNRRSARRASCHADEAVARYLRAEQDDGGDGSSYGMHAAWSDETEQKVRSLMASRRQTKCSAGAGPPPNRSSRASIDQPQAACAGGGGNTGPHSRLEAPPARPMRPSSCCYSPVALQALRSALASAAVDNLGCGGARAARSAGQSPSAQAGTADPDVDGPTDSARVETSDALQLADELLEGVIAALDQAAGGHAADRGAPVNCSVPRSLPPPAAKQPGGSSRTAARALLPQIAKGQQRSKNPQAAIVAGNGGAKSAPTNAHQVNSRQDACMLKAQQLLNATGRFCDDIDGHGSSADDEENVQAVIARCHRLILTVMPEADDSDLNAARDAKVDRLISSFRRYQALPSITLQACMAAEALESPQKGYPLQAEMANGGTDAGLTPACPAADGCVRRRSLGVEDMLATALDSVVAFLDGKCGIKAHDFQPQPPSDMMDFGAALRGHDASAKAAAVQALEAAIENQRYNDAQEAAQPFMERCLHRHRASAQEHASNCASGQDGEVQIVLDTTPVALKPQSTPAGLHRRVGKSVCRAEDGQEWVYGPPCADNASASIAAADSGSGSNAQKSQQKVAAGNFKKSKSRAFTAGKSTKDCVMM